MNTSFFKGFMVHVTMFLDLFSFRVVPINSIPTWFSTHLGDTLDSLCQNKMKMSRNDGNWQQGSNTIAR